MDTYTLLKYFDCKVTAEEEAAVLEWLMDDPDGEKAEKYKSVHMTYMAQKLYLDEPLQKHRKIGLKSSLKVFSRVAAIIVVAVLTGVMTNMWTVDRISEQVEVIKVPAGERLHMTLADGTRMWLNSGTEVEIPVIFSRDERNLRLVEGEILLAVERDEDRPFVVDTWAGKIEVLGTRFNVMADKDRGIFTTALLEGSVKIASKLDSKDECILEPNDIATMVNGSLNVGRVKDVSAVACWSSGLIDVTDVPFDELMRKFEKAFDVRVFIDRTDLPVVTYTRGKVRVSDGIDHALSVLQLASDFSYSFDRLTNTVIIK